MRLEPILPKKTVFQVLSTASPQLLLRMQTLVADLQRTATNYEAPPSPSYRRTMNLARSWFGKTYWRGGDLVGEVMSAKGVAPYNVYVRGKRIGPKGQRQAAHMRNRGWLSVDQILLTEWPRARKDFWHILLGSAKAVRGLR